ncbi:MAG: DUF6465 family protein [Defluviitaleaceae bacterium]|nr:DUF6465 family protein [Defluviitaleaceae bacterium]
MKIEYFVELDGNQTDFKMITDTVKDIWKAEGNAIKDLRTMAVYFKPQDKMCYYVINGISQGGFQIT